MSEKPLQHFTHGNLEWVKRDYGDYELSGSRQHLMAESFQTQCRVDGLKMT